MVSALALLLTFLVFFGGGFALWSYYTSASTSTLTGIITGTSTSIGGIVLAVYGNFTTFLVLGFNPANGFGYTVLLVGTTICAVMFLVNGISSNGKTFYR